MKYSTFLNHVLACLCLVSVINVAHAQRLDQLITLTLNNHPEIQSSRLLRDASGADVKSARWQFYPTASLSVDRASTSSNDTSFLGDSEVARVGLVQPLWAGGSLKNNLTLTQANFDLSDASVAQTAQSLSLRVLSAYVEWYSAHLGVQAWQQSVQMHQTLSDQVHRRTSGGASSESDAALANARVAITKADLASAVAAEDTALAVLTQLVGQKILSSDLVSESSQPINIVGNAEYLSELAQENNPVVASALAEADVAAAQAKVVKSQSKPEVNLRFERQYGNLGFADSNSTSNRIFLEFQTRFGAGLSNFSDLRAARLRRQAAVSSVDVVRQMLRINIASDFVLKKSAQQRLVALSESRQATAQVHASFERQFLAGSRTWLDLLNSARELTQLDLQIASTRGSELLVSWRLSILSKGLNSVLADSQ